LIFTGEFIVDIAAIVCGLDLGFKRGFYFKTPQILPVDSLKKRMSHHFFCVVIAPEPFLGISLEKLGQNRF